LISEHSEVGEATVFISHAWSFEFLDFVEALIDYFDHIESSKKENIILWIDLFSNNQHHCVSYDFQWWSTTFLSAIAQFHSTLMVFSPWHNPIPLTRGWCIWELYCTIQSKSHFNIALSKKEKQRFIEDINQHPGQVC
jgi:hypothetical protein